MHIVFCIDDTPQTLRLLQVAVRSLRKCMGDDIPCLCVYTGENEQTLQSLEQETIPIALYKPLLTKAHIPKKFHRQISRFLKLELSLIPELEKDDFFLYCDVAVLFQQNIAELLTLQPPYMAMTKETTIPFYHECEHLEYTWRENDYKISMPFPVATYNSDVILFNAQRLRKFNYVHNFLAFCEQNMDKVNDFEQSLLNYFFGNRITLLANKWNRSPEHADAKYAAHIVHFHTQKPWDVAKPTWKNFRTQFSEPLCEKWFTYLTPTESEEVATWAKPSSISK